MNNRLDSNEFERFSEHCRVKCETDEACAFAEDHMPNHMPKKKLFYSVVAIASVILAALLTWGVTARNAYEEAEYKIIEVDGPFEIREYPQLMIATTGMSDAFQSKDGSFMRLFRYIDGENEQNQQVAMTTPVFLEPENEDSPGKMGFVLPKNVAENGAPIPKSTDVEIGVRTGGQFAALRFSGRINAQTSAQAEERLKQWIVEQNLASKGKVEFAGYDPPWTPGPFRRNEVLIRLD